MADSKFDMRNLAHFPVITTLPVDDGDIDNNFLHYYDDEGEYNVWTPVNHWCLLVEIVEVMDWYVFRPMFRAKDKAGTQFIVTFYLDGGARLPTILDKYAKEGNVMAIMYPDNHLFVDGQRGIRIEDVDRVKTFPCTLDQFLRIGDEIASFSSDKCRGCNVEAPLRCSSCSVRYCNKACQTRDWKERHKKECKAVKQIIEYKGKNWRRFEGHWN